MTKRLEVHGIDGSSELQLYGEAFDELQLHLESRDRGEELPERINGWTVLRYNVGRGFTYYEIVLYREGLRFEFTRAGRGWSDSKQQARLILGYEFIRRFNGLDCIDEAIQLVSRSLIHLDHYHISRLDVQVTYNVDFDELITKYYDNLVTVGNNRVIHTIKSGKGQNKTTSVSFGNNEIYGIIYNKALEITQKGSDTKADDLQVFFGQIKKLTRFEWRLRRRWLKRYGISTVEDLRENWTGLVNKLFQWMRFQEDPAVQYNRAKIFKFWELLRLAVLKQPNIINKRGILTRVKRTPSPHYLRLIKASLSQLAGAMAPKCKTFEESLSEGYKIIFNNLTYFENRFKKRRQQFEKLYGLL